MSNSAAPVLDSQGMLRSTIATQPERLLTINEVAAWFGVSKAWVYDHTTERGHSCLASDSVRLTRFRRAEIESFIRTHAKIEWIQAGSVRDKIDSVGGAHMGRDRYQEGRLVMVGKHVKKWRGHFYVYEKQADGSEKRRFRNILLASSPRWTKAQAKQKLREI